MKAAHDEMPNEELAILARNDDKTLEVLVNRNEGFTVFMASGFLRRHGFYDQYQTGLVEDYSQICRIAVMKAVKNYDPKKGAKFLTYAGRIMWNDMLGQMEKDSDYRENVIDVLQEEEDTTNEECDEEYGDGYDNGYENRRSCDWNIMPSTLYYGIKGPIIIEKNETDDDRFRMAGMNRFTGYIRKIAEAENQEKTTSKKKVKVKLKYESCKTTDHSWRYPVYHTAIKDMQITTILQGLLGKDFNETQREYLIYRYGLKSLEPQSQKETAEHFYLSKSYAKKIENDGLDELKGELIKMYLL